MEKTIDLQNVSYRYPNSKIQSLSEITFTVKTGKLTLIMGSTGAGKTTLSMCLNGLIPQLFGGELTGELVVAGLNLREYRVQTLARNIGLVLQDPETQIFGITVFDDTAFGLRNFLVPAAEIKARVTEALKKVGLDGYQDRNTAELSGGEKQRLAIAGILVLKPDVLVLDEPASELDPTGRYAIYQFIAALRREQHLTVLVTEHLAEDIIGQADEVIILVQGSIAWQGNATDLFRDLTLLDRFGIKPLPLTQIGWEFYQKEWISYSQIPLDLSSCVKMIQKLLSSAGKHRFEKKVIPEGASLSANSPKPDCSAPVIIQVENLSYQFSSKNGNGLHNINLKVLQGQFVAIIGPNGAGKTTLAKHFNGLLKPKYGKVFIDGMNTASVDTAKLAQIVGYVFQNPDHQLFCVSIEKELEYGLLHTSLSDLEKKARIEQVLQLLELEPYRHIHPFKLGKGERQRVALASILVLKPKILVIDEPTTGLDWRGVQKLMGFLKELHQQGSTIIMITHDMDLVARYASNVIVMKQGTLLAEGSPKTIFADFAMLAAASIISPAVVRLSAQLRASGLPEIFLDEKELTRKLISELED
jgi:energy-coupling factor transport system ATP-binding protein